MRDCIFGRKFSRMRFLLFCLLLPFSACDTPRQKLRRLQRDFLERYPQPPGFLIVSGQDTLTLPRPLDQQVLVSGRAAAALLLAEANTLEAKALQPVEQARLAAFKIMLDSLSRPDNTVLTDPRRYCVAEVLTPFVQTPGPVPATLLLLLERLPEYYALIQEDWVAANDQQATAAIDCSLRALDQLDTLATRPGIPAEPLYRARLAIKDFIGRCQSEVLE